MIQRSELRIATAIREVDNPEICTPRLSEIGTNPPAPSSQKAWISSLDHGQLACPHVKASTGWSSKAVGLGSRYDLTENWASATSCAPEMVVDPHPGPGENQLPVDLDVPGRRSSVLCEAAHPPSSHCAEANLAQLPKDQCMLQLGLTASENCHFVDPVILRAKSGWVPQWAAAQYHATAFHDVTLMRRVWLSRQVGGKFPVGPHRARWQSPAARVPLSGWHSETWATQAGQADACYPL